MTREKIGEGAAIQIWNDRNPQGYSYRVHGDFSRVMVDFEGIALAMVPEEKRKQRRRKKE